MNIVLTIRTGEPLGNRRGGAVSKFEFTLEDGFNTLIAECTRLFSLENVRLGKANLPPLQLLIENDLYFRQAKGKPQKDFALVNDDESLTQWMKHRWRCHSDSNVVEEPDFEFFMYVKVIKIVTCHRATDKRIQASQKARECFQKLHDVHIGKIEGHHLDVSHARKPGQAEYTRDESNTTKQARFLDSVMEKIPKATKESDDIMSIPFSISNGMLHVSRTFIKGQLGLPNHDMNIGGIFRDFIPNMPTHDVEDNEHAVNDHTAHNSE